LRFNSAICYLFILLNSDISDETRGLELTRTINTVKMPLCADVEARKQIGPWLRGKGLELDVNSCLCHPIEQMLKEHGRERDDILVKDLDQLAIQTGSGLTSKGSKSRSGVASKKRATTAKRSKVYRPEGDPRNARHIAQPRAPKHAEDDTHVPTGMSLDDEDPEADTHLYQTFSEMGPYAWIWDGVKSFVWDLFTHPGFLTYPHQDASGFATYALMRTGCKIWCILRPKIDSSVNSRSKLFDILRIMLRQHPHLDYQGVSDSYTIFLMEGDVL
jgi:hypothetical protein